MVGKHVDGQLMTTEERLTRLNATKELALILAEEI